MIMQLHLKLPVKLRFNGELILMKKSAVIETCFQGVDIRAGA